MVKKSIVLGMMLALGLLFSFSSQGLAEEKGLVGWWKFDEEKGEIAKDSSGNGNDGTLYGPEWVKCGLEFDGEDDYVKIPASGSLDITEQITIEAWVKPDMSSLNFYNNVITTKKDVWAFGTGGGDKVHFLVHYGHHKSEAEQKLWNVTGYSESCLEPDAFHHIVGTFDSETGTVKVYANGELVSSKAGDDVPTPSPGWFSIGHHPGHGPSWFKGTIGEVKIYNRVLSEKEINDNYNSILYQHNPSITVKNYSKELPLTIKGIKGKAKGDGAKSIAKGKGIWLLQGEKKKSWGYSIFPNNKLKNIEIKGKFKTAMPGNIHNVSWAWLDRDEPGYDFCIISRHKNEGVFYRFQFSSRWNEVALWKEGEPDTDPDAPSIPSGFFAVVKKQEIVKGKEYTFCLKIIENKIVLNIDGNNVLEYEDSILPLDSDGIGFGVYDGARVVLSDIEVSKAIGAINIPDKKHLFRTTKWLDNQDWIFDNDEPILLMCTNGYAHSVKLKPGYRPQVYWPNYFRIDWKAIMRKSEWKPLNTTGNFIECRVLYMENDEASAKGLLKIGYDSKKDSYSYDFERNLSIKKDNAFGIKKFNGIEYFNYYFYNPMPPAQDCLKKALNYTGSSYWSTAASPYKMALVKGVDGEFYRWPIHHFWVGRSKLAKDSLFVMYPDRVICPAMEIISLGKEYAPYNVSCCAIWDMHHLFSPIEKGKKITKLNAGTVYNAKFRVIGYPRKEADEIRKEAAKLLPGQYPFLSHDPSVEKAYYTLGRNDFSKGGNIEETYARLIWFGGKWDKTTGRNDSFSMRLENNCTMYASVGYNSELPTAKSSEVSAWVKIDEKWEGKGVRLGIWRYFAGTGWLKNIWMDYFSPKVGEWQKITFKIQEPIGNLMRIKVQTSGKGTLWIDDLEFKKIEPYPPSKCGGKPF